MIAYKDRGQRKSWGPKGLRGFYLGPAMAHYHCARVHIPSTRSERVVRTVQFYPYLCAVPTVSPTNEATRAVHRLSNVLR